MDYVDTFGDPLVPEHAEGLASIREPRNSVFLAAQLGRFGTDAVTSHRVRDLSSAGARIDRAAALRRGETVLVSVGSLDAIAATVMWVADDAAGLKFFEPMDPAAARSKTVLTPAPGGTGPLKVMREREATLAGWLADLDDVYG